MSKAAFGFALIIMLGCDNPLFCDREESVMEVIYGDEVSQGWFELSRDIGWKCNDAGAIRNAFGGVIGRKYNCEICR